MAAILSNSRSRCRHIWHTAIYDAHWKQLARLLTTGKVKVRLVLAGRSGSAQVLVAIWTLIWCFSYRQSSLEGPPGPHRVRHNAALYCNMGMSSRSDSVVSAAHTVQARDSFVYFDGELLACAML